MHNELSAIKCTRAHVYKDKGRLYIDYWDIDEANPKIEIHISKMPLDLKCMQFNTDKIKHPHVDMVIISREIMASSDKDEIFEILVKDDRKIKIEVIKNLDNSIIYVIPTGGDKPLKAIFANNSDQALDIETKNESLILERVRIIDVLSKKASGYESNNN